MDTKYSFDGISFGLSLLYPTNASLDPDNIDGNPTYRRASAFVAGPDEREFAG